MILFDDVDIDEVKVVFDSSFDGKSVNFGITEGERWETFMGGPKESNIQIEGYEGDGVCELCGGPVFWSYLVECFITWEHYRD